MLKPVIKIIGAIFLFILFIGILSIPVQLMFETFGLVVGIFSLIISCAGIIWIMYVILMENL